MWTHNSELACIRTDIAARTKPWAKSLHSWCITAAAVLDNAELYAQGIDVTGSLIVREFGIVSHTLYSAAWDIAVASFLPWRVHTSTQTKRYFDALHTENDMDTDTDYVPPHKSRRMS